LSLEDLRISVPPPSSDDELTGLLTKHAGNISAVARELATSRTQIARLLVRHGLRAEDFRRGG
ncbi:MAG TPA: hypothetical protein VGC41_29365, partial [Kofleriaceae bacterium]